MQRTFGDHITIQPYRDRSGGEPELGFIEAIASILSDIWRSQVGRALISHLRGNIQIYPLWAELTMLPPGSVQRSPAVTSTEALSTLRDPQGNPDIFFSTRLAANTEALADGVLVHELTHALRFVGGLLNRSFPLVDVPGPEWSYPDREEWFAHTVLNMYQLERGRPATIAYHWYSAARTPRTAVAPPAHSLRRARTEETAYDARLLSIARFEQTNIRHWAHPATWLGGVFNAFASLDRDRVPYNPFRDAWVRHPQVLIPWAAARYR